MRILFVVPFIFVAISAQAQIDPSSILLLRQGQPSSTRESGLDSGRYTVKPGAKPTRSAEVTRRSPTPMPVPSATPASNEVQPGAVESSQTKVQAGETAVVTPSPVPVAETSNVPTLVKNPEPGSFLAGDQPVVEQPGVTETVLGGTEEELQQYKELLNPEDRRRNILEISLAPAFIYNQSRSAYLFRDYTTAAPGASAEAKIWFSPFFGLQGSYMTTLSGSLSDSFSSQEFVPVTQSWIRAGIRSRSFLTSGRYSPSLTFGLDYYEYRLKVPGDADNRGNLKTTGASLTLDGEWPVSGRTSWLMGLSFLPKASHKETPTDLNLHSGDRADTNGVGISLGARVQYDRTNAMFIRISHQLEKHVFSGDASEPDPRTGVAPSGVPVTNSFTILQLGFTWGN